MKILQIVNRIPYPPTDGGNIAVLFFTKGFTEAGIALSMLAMNTTRHWVEPNQLPEIFNQLKHFKTVKIDNRIRPIPALINLFTKQSYHVSRFISKDFETTLINLLKKESFDIIQLEGLFLMPYVPVIRKFSKAKIALRQHNIEYIIWQRLAGQEKNLLKRKYLLLLTNRLKKFEKKSLNEVDILLPISETDKKTALSLGAKVPIHTITFGPDISQIPFSPGTQTPPTLYHLGAMDWQPNKEGILFLLEKVMPLVWEEIPNARLHLAGRNMPGSFYRFQNENVFIHGEVPDAVEFEKDKSILVVPILSGGGVRIKIFKAMAMGKAVVSTPVGMEGIQITSGIQGLIAKNAGEMAKQIIFLIQNPQKITEMGRQARIFIQENYDQKVLIQQLLKIYENLIKDKESV